jgi:predicted nucleotidyltransferase
LLGILREKLEIRELARNWRLWGKKIARGAREVLVECGVYIFGSVSRGSATGASDVDVLIFSDNVPRDGKSRGEIKARIEESAGLPSYHPFEIHLATKAETNVNPIYRKAIKEGIPF